MRTPTGSPLRLVPFRRERLLLALIAVAALAIVNPLNTQDVVRLALTTQLLDHGSVRIDPYASDTRDRSFRAGHFYSDKAPGVSVLALPVVAASRALDRAQGVRQRPPVWRRVTHLWAIRILIGGGSLLALVLLVGRVAEGLRRGTGGVVAVTVALGSMIGPAAATTFEHLPGAALSFGAFVAATQRRWSVAGALVGAAVLCEYQDAIVAVALTAYALLAGARAATVRLLAGAAPFAVLLGAYNAVAFGRPWHFSYGYVANDFTSRQQRGLFGITAPTAHGVETFLWSSRGLLVISPWVVAALAGLARGLLREHRLEGWLCAAVTVVFVVLTCGYFDPLGGTSPGPRFFIPALPFLALGLPYALERAPRLVGVLAAAALALACGDALTWAITGAYRWGGYPDTIFAHAGTGMVVGTWLLVAAWGAAALLCTRQIGELAR